MVWQAPNLLTVTMEAYPVRSAIDAQGPKSVKWRSSMCGPEALNVPPHFAE
jgi:hypothetical protein